MVKNKALKLWAAFIISLLWLPEMGAHTPEPSPSQCRNLFLKGGREFKQELGLFPLGSREGRKEYLLTGNFSSWPASLVKRLEALTKLQNVQILISEMGSLDGGQRIHAHTSLENEKVTVRFGLHTLKDMLFFERLVAHESVHVQTYLEFLKLKDEPKKVLAQLRFSRKSDHGSLIKLPLQFRSSLDTQEYKAYHEEAKVLRELSQDLKLSLQERAGYQKQAYDLMQLSENLAKVTSENLNVFQDFLYNIRKKNLPVPLTEVQPRFDICKGCYEIEIPLFPITFQVRLVLLMRPQINEKNEVLINGDQILAALQVELVDFAIQEIRMGR